MSAHDQISLKWGTLKSWRLHSEPARAAMQAYVDSGVCGSAMLQNDTPEQVDLLCNLIDALDADTVFLEWDGENVTKEEAKAYVRGYPREAVHGAPAA
jgi:hypothetical protein